jgi:hypothetical protein
MSPDRLEYRHEAVQAYPDVLTREVRDALAALAVLDDERKALMRARMTRRVQRATAGAPIRFLPPDALIGRTSIAVADARAGRFEGSDVPGDLQRQWIQGTGPATRPRADQAQSLRNVAYALLSGADGWMFDGEDALGQVSTMSLENQRSLKLAIARDPLFLGVAAGVADARSSTTGRRSSTSPRASSGREASTSTTDTSASPTVSAFLRPLSTCACTSRTTIRRCVRRARPWCCTCRRFRRPRKRRCGTGC